MKKLLNALDDATNVKRIEFNNETKQWLVKFHKGNDNVVEKNGIVSFLKNV